MSTLEGQKILVVGGSSGIGFGVAKLSILEEATSVTIASSNKARVDEAVSRLISETENKIRDVRQKVRGEVVDAKIGTDVKALLGRVGEIDHLIWTAGDVTPHLRDHNVMASTDDQKDLFNVRFWGPIEAVKSAKIKSSGSIIFTTGTVLNKPAKGWGVVAGVAGAIDAMTRGFAIDYAPIRVNSVCPGSVLTEFQDLMMDKATKEMVVANTASKLPVKHVAYPDETAEAYIFLMKCKYITGQRVTIDGGSSLI